MKQRASKIIVVTGRKGRGKSYWIKAFLNRMPRNVPVIVNDVQRDYADGDNALKHLDFEGTLDEYLTLQGNSKAWIGRVRIDARADINDLRRLIAFATRADGKKWLVIDELHLWKRHELDKIGLPAALFGSRHTRTSIIVAAWRPADIPRELTMGADELVAFQTEEPRDLKYWRDAVGPEFSEQLPDLRMGKPLHHKRNQTTRKAKT